MKKVFSGLVLILLFPFHLLKKTKIDNFVGGLMFGALFSLFVNIVTVKIQEDITRQRTLEALEREIVGHFLMANSIIRDEKSAYEKADDEYFSPTTVSFRYDTRTFQSDQVTAHLFEIEPKVAAKIETYYSFIIQNANQNLSKNDKIYTELSQNCELMYDIFYGGQRESKEKCNDLARKTLTANTVFSSLIYDNVEEIQKDFHPTQDRLNSWWLKLLLGDQAYEVMKKQV